MEEALDSLEVSRGTILGYLIDGRSELSELKASYPEHEALYASLQRARACRRGEKVEPEARQELDRYILEIRQLPGFQRFLLGPTAQELKESAVHGPIVVFNITGTRIDVIIITSSTIESLQLGEDTQTLIWYLLDLTS